jgi:hypothetical protein
VVTCDEGLRRTLAWYREQAGVVVGVPAAAGQRT